MRPLADGAVDPLPWSDFAQVLIQLGVFAVACWGGGWLVLDLHRRWTAHRKVESALADAEHRAWIDGIRRELDASPEGQPENGPLETPGSAWSVPGTVSGVLRPDGGQNRYGLSCGACRHPLGHHAENGVCTEVQCLAMGEDQVCPEAVTALRQLDHRLPRVNWSAPSNWSLFCRKCGHRMAHHEPFKDGMIECPPGPPGPFHDGLGQA